MIAFLAITAFVLLPIAAACVWPVSRIVSSGLSLATIACSAYLMHPWYPLHWITACITMFCGLLAVCCHVVDARDAGAWRRAVAEQLRRGLPSVELMRTLSHVHTRLAVATSGQWLAALLTASSVVDFVALTRWENGSPWGVQPILQIVVLLAMIAISRKAVQAHSTEPAMAPQEASR